MPDKDTYPGKSAYKGVIVESYESDRMGEPVWGVEQAWVEKWINTLPSGARVLDLPVGTGRFVEAMLARGIRLHGVDVSEDMIGAAAKRGEGSLALTLTKADVEALPFANDAFDHVICWRLMHLLPAANAERAMRELARVCRENLVVQVFGVIVRPRRFDRLRTFVRRIWSRRAALAPTPWSHIESFSHTEQMLRAMFRRSGLRVANEEILAEYGGRPVKVYVLSRIDGFA